MAIQRLEMFDGVEYEYRPDERVDLWVEGFKVVVYKPYRAPYYNFGSKGVVFIEPKIYMSTNATVEMTPEGFRIINKAVQGAINILNKEGNNIIKNEDFNESQASINISECPYPKGKAESGVKQTIKYSAGSFIEEANGRVSLYLGSGNISVLRESLKNQGNVNNQYWANMNRSGSLEIYLDFDNIKDINIKKIYKTSTKVTISDLKGSCRIDTFVNKRKAVKIDHTYVGSIHAIDIINELGFVTNYEIAGIKHYIKR